MRRRSGWWPLAVPLPACLALLLALSPPCHGGTRDDHEALVLDRATSTAKVATAVEVRDQVAVVEVVGDYDKNLADGTLNAAPREDVARRFYELQPDAYDFLVAFSTFEFDAGAAKAFAWGVQNTDQGIGLPQFDNSDLFGSDGRLQSFIDMEALSGSSTDPLDPRFEETLTTLTHEIMHRWGARVHFALPDGSPSDELLGVDGSHWSFLLDSRASVMYGNRWRDEGDGTFTSVGTLKFYSPLDLYLAGFYGPEEVPPFFVIEGSGEDPTRLPSLGATVTGTRRDVTIDDVIAAEGPRVPPASEAPHEFRVAFLLLTRPGETVTDDMIAAIDRVRAALQTRFAAMTGGRAVMDIAAPASVDQDPGAPEGVDGGDLRPAAVLNDGLTWLRSHQNGEGFWEDTPATRIRDTALAASTLASLDPLFDGGPAAAAWLADQQAASTDSLARLAIALDSLAAGGSVPLRAALRERVNADGGWGVAAGYASDPLDTALAVTALVGDPSAAVDGGISYLLAAQNPDGGWSNFPGGASRTLVTTEVVRAFERAGRRDALPSSVFSWFGGRQNADGGLGDSPSTVHGTANALEALSTTGHLGSIGAAAANAYLDTHQSVDGSWAGSVYSTALAVSAIKRFNFPNLAFLESPSVAPPSPRDGERVTLTVPVVNDGRLAVSGGIVRLVEGDPDAGGTPVGGDVTLPPLASGQSATVTVTWDSLDRAGTNTLVLLLDPDDAVTELSELDNRATVEVEVKPAPAEPDLELRPEDISFTPAQPAELPTSLGIAVTVRNLGQTDAEGAVVRLYRGDPADGVTVGEESLLVPQRSSAVATFTDLLETAGSTSYTAVADAVDAIAEADETNNRASATVTTAGTVDLSVTPADVSLAGAAYLDNDLTFRVVFHNTGTLDSPDAVVRYRVTDGVETRELGGSTVQIDAGGTAEREVTWRVDLVGDLELVAEIDPDDLVPEADEDDNAAHVPFTATEASEPNLVIDRGALRFDPDPAREGAALDLTATVRNAAGGTVADAQVAFYDGDPTQGGTRLGVATVPSLGPGESADAVFTWSRVPSAADRLIVAVADPDDLVAELDEDDNSTFEILQVLSLPDPSLAPASLALDPAFPRPDQPVTLTVEVSNLGEQELSGLVVRAFDDGVPLGGDQTVASLPGLGAATATFVWTVGPADGEARQVTVRVDPDGAVEEGSEANNEASIPITVQDGDFFVTYRYLSPNGDGVQDTTQLFFRLPAATPVAVEVVDAVRNEVVRRAELGTVAGGQFEWDGRDDRGRLVRDADYRLRLVDLSGAVLGTTTVSVDTDRLSLLKAAGTPYEAFTNLTCDLPFVSAPEVTGDEQWLYFAVEQAGDAVYPPGIYRIRPDGSDLAQIVPAAFFDGTVPADLVISGDGSKIAFYRIQSSPFFRELWVANGDGSQLTELVNSEDPNRSELPYGFTAAGDALVVYRSPNRIYRRPVDGVSSAELLLQASVADEVLSPDGRFLFYTDLNVGAPRLLDVDGGEVVSLPPVTVATDGARFSPDGSQLALADLDSGRVVVVGTDGAVLRSLDFPTEPAPPEVLDVIPNLDPAADVPTLLEEMSWARSGTELAVTVLYGGVCSGGDYGRIVRFDLGSGEVETVAYTQPRDNCFSYHVSTWDGSGWVERGVLHAGLRYEGLRLDLADSLPDADGEYKVRIRQTGQEAAHVEAVGLSAYDTLHRPSEAFVVGGADALALVTTFDGDVLDLHDKTMEVRWSGVPAEGGATLELVAREETLSDRNASPFHYPAGDGGSYSVLAAGGAPMVVDGEQTAADGLVQPLFRQWSAPDTGHPSAEVVGYASSDGESLYAALDFTVDNTLDGTADWAALEVLTADGWRQLEVTTADTAWGRVGFTRTAGVHYRHKYYEFRVPLSEIGVDPGAVVEIRFAAYGTAALLPEEDFLPHFGGALWDPNDRALLYTGDELGQPSYVLFLDEDNRTVPVFSTWNAFESPRFSPTGRLLFFESSDARNDPQSSCYLRGYNDSWAFRSLLNLTADLRPRRSATLSGVLLEGTAADVHFDRYTLEYATVEQPDVWHAIQAPSARPVVDGRFTTWVPPGPGSYLVRLTSYDLAGNRRRSIRRVVSSDAPSITDLSLTPDLVSPNGDGVRDTADIHYRVLQPVHLDFRFFDRDGVRVRTIRRDESAIGAEVDVPWDGRDDQGLPLPDGEYRMTVQSYELFVTLDSTAPEVTALLQGAKQCVESSLAQQSVVGVDPSIGYQVDEPNLESVTVETGEGAMPVSWSPILGPSEDAAGSVDLSLAELVDHSFRVQAIDRAGNRATAATGLAPEELIVTGFGRLELNPATGQLRPLNPLPCSGATFALEQGDARFAVAESIAPDLSTMAVEVQPVPSVDGIPRFDQLDPNGWFATPVTQFDRPGSPIPPETFAFDWGMESVTPGVLTAVRLHAVDTTGRDHLSDLFSVQTDGITFHGVLEDDPALRAALPEDERDRLVLWGEELVAEDLEDVTLYLSSDEDPRYATPRAIPASVVLDGKFAFTAEDWQACLHYEGYVVATTVPTFDPVSGQTVRRTLTTDSAGFRFPCLAVSATMEPFAIGACNQPAPTSVRTLSVHVESLDQRPLQLLTVEGPDETGTSEVLFSVNEPASGSDFSFDFDTADIPEGAYPLSVRLTNVDGQRATAAATLVVDRTAPSRLEITYPVDGQRVCGVQEGPSSVVHIEGTIEDNLGALFILEAGQGQEPESWRQINTIGVPPLSPQGGSLALSELPRRVSGRLGSVADTSGELSLRLRATDHGGAQVCTEPIVFTFDGRLDGAAASLDRELLSPDGDGVLDEVTLSVAAGEPTSVDAVVVPADYDPTFDTCSPTGGLVRTLFTDLPVFDVGQAVWDGRDDLGGVVPDGWYGIALTFRDGCGNEAVLTRCLEVDTTPPDLAIAHPTTSSPLTQIVEVLGSVHDPHLQSWTLEYGVGSDPATWARIDSGDRDQADEVLGSWNTFGLGGGYTLRLSAVDTLGNAAEVRVPLTISTSLELLQYLEALPRPFSPNGDGRRDELTIRLGLENEAQVDVTVLDGSDVPVRTLRSGALLQPGAAVVTWDGLDDGGQPVPDGSYQVVVLARLASDPAVTQEERVSTVLDATPPLLRFDRPTDGSFVPSAGAIEATIQDEHLGEYVASLTDQPQAPTWTEIARGTEPRTDYPLGSLADLDEGDYGLRLEAVDLGESRSEQVIRFVVDDAAPVVTLSAPLDGSFFDGAAPVPVSGAIDEENLDTWVLEAGAGTAPTEWTTIAAGSQLPVPEPLGAWNLSGVADGVYVLRLTATDRAGLSGSAQAAVTVDATPPALAITTPAAGGYVTGPTVISGTATDAHLVSYEIALAAGSGAPFSVLGTGAAPVSDGALFQWLALPPDGPYTVRLRATDAAGNQASTVREVTVDTAPPAPPVGLVVQVEDQRDAHLIWQPSTEPDLEGYQVDRDGRRVTSQPLASPSFVDPNLADGEYSYTVVAVDRAGQESGPSAPRVARVDVSPPAAEIQIPADGARVGGLVDITGTAHSADDFKEYRLVAEPAAGGAAQLLRTSPVPTLSDLLAQWDVSALPEGAAYTLRLEAEDLSGNVATATVAVTIDNQPPAAPTGLTATVTGADVALVWDAGAESDLAGYLLYRDGRLANATGAVIGSLDPFVLSATAYDDSDRPDGTFLYEVYAIDRAGNVSDPSAPVEATVETGPPAAALVQPADGTEFETDLYLLATSEDSDVDRVQMQVREAGSGAWTDLGATIEDEPWETDWDPAAAGLPYGDYDLRAVATDFGGSTDPSPVAITVTYTDLTPPARVTGLTAAVDGAEVTLAWDANTSDPDLDGYQVERTASNGSTVRLTTASVQATTFTDSGVTEGRFTYRVIAVDEIGNEADGSDGAEARIYTPVLAQPFTPIREAGVDFVGHGAATNGTVEASLATAGGASQLAPVASDADGAFTFTDVALSAGVNQLTVTAVDADGNRSKPATARVVSGAAPSTPTGLVATPAGGLDVDLSWNPNPEADLFAYRLFRDGAPLPPTAPITDLTPSASSSASSYAAPETVVDGDPDTCWQPQYSPSPAGEWVELSWPDRRSVERVEIDWSSFVANDGTVYTDAAERWSLEAWDGAVWVPLATVEGDASPSATVALAAPYLTDRVRLLLGDGTTYPCVVEMRVVHDPLTSATAFTDSATDGRFQYQVLAVDELGFESPPTDPVAIDVGDVEPPEPVVLSASAVGSDVHLSWTASASSDVVRYDLSRDGERILQHTDLADLTAVDAGLANGTYSYVVTAVDGAGNASTPSAAVEVTVSVAPPAAPVSLTIASPPVSGALDLSWSAGAGAPPAGYRVGRSTTSDGPYAAVTTTPDTSFRDSGLSDGTTYYYVVFALDALGNASGPSNEASGTPADDEPPAPPVLYYPGFQGGTITVERTPVTVAGAAEPGSDVSLLLDGREVATTSALVAAQRLDADGFFVYGIPRLSPDGRWLWSDDNGYYDHWDFETSDGVFADVLTGALWARWLPDSSGVVFTDEGSFDPGPHLKVYHPADGSIETLLTSDLVVAAEPARDGRHFALIGTHDGQAGLWWVALDPAGDGDEWTLLLAGQDYEFLAESLVVSPDGRRIAVQHGLGGTKPLEVVGVADGSDQVVAANPWSEIPPRWAVDGERLLFATDPGDPQLSVWDAAVSASDPVTGQIPGLAAAVFSPAGDAVLYAVSGDGFYRQDLAGGAPELLEETPGAYALGLDASSLGYLVFVADGAATRVTPAGRFAVDDVDLAPGDNTFTGLAVDGVGNQSAESAPMVVHLEVAGRPDLEIAAGGVAVFPAVPQVGSSGRISVTVRNVGSTPSPAADLGLVLIAPDGGVEPLAVGGPLPALAAGASTAVTVDHLFLGDPGIYRARAAVDPLDGIAEVSESNNVAEVSFAVAVDGEPLLTVETDREQYVAEQDVDATLTLYNLGQPLDGTITVTIEDAAGYEVTRLADEPVADLAYGASLTVERSWNTGTVFAGDYQVAARLLDGGGVVLASASAPFEVLEAATLSAAVVSDRATYPPGATAHFTGSVDYVAGNATLSGAEARLRLRDASDGLVQEWLEPLGDLLPAASATVPFDWSSTGAAAGSYTATFEILRGGEVAASAATSFVLGAQGVSIEGALTPADGAPAIGTPLDVAFTVTNTGSQALTAVPVTVTVRDTVSGTVLASQVGAADLPVGGTDGGTVSFATEPLGLGTFLVVLEAGLPDGAGGTAMVTLDSAGVSTVDATAPVVSVSSPVDGAVVGADAIAVVTAHDQLSRIDRVEVSIDDGPWIAAALADGPTGRYERPLDGLEEGAHTLAARATDTAGNRATVAPVPFTVTFVPELAATKVDRLVTDADGDGWPSAGDTIGYTIAVSSFGDVGVTGVRLDDTLPAEMTLVAGSLATDTGTVLSEQPIAVDLGDLAPGASATVTYQAMLAPSLPPEVEEVENQGVVTSAELPALSTDDPALAGAADPTVTVLTPMPRLAASKEDALVVDADGDGEPSAGDTLRYTIRLVNNGNLAATEVELADSAPDGTTLVAGSLTHDRGVVLSEDPVSVRISTLEAAGAATVTFDVTVDSPLSAGRSQVVNQGLVTSAELPDLPTDDPALAGAADPTVTELVGTPVLTAEKTDMLVDDLDGDGDASPGDAVLYQVTVANSGNGPATGVVLTDPIPDGAALEPGTVQTSQGAVIGENPVEVDLGTLTAGATATVSFRVRVAAGDPVPVDELSNQATVTSAELPAVPTDDPATATPSDPTLTPVRVAPQVTLGDASVVEGDAGTVAAQLAVTLDRPSNRPFTATWASVDGSALAGIDYLAASGTVTVPAGETAATIVVAVVGDRVDELDEAFSVELREPAGGVLQDATGVVTVLDDDQASVSVGDAEGLEGDADTTPLLFAVTLDLASDRETRVDWTTVPDTAEEGVDFTPAAGTAVLAAGETRADVAVDVIGDTLLEDDETFTVELSNPVEVAVADATGVGTIRDDEECLGANLLRNPGAETETADGEIPEWTEVEGTDWQRWLSPPDPAEGEASFYAGTAGPDGFAELVQDVDLSAYAAPIADGDERFRFEGSVRTLDESPPDVARILVEYLGADGSTVLDAWDSGDVVSPAAWTEVGDERAVPPGTAFARVHLLATLFAGDTVDGFFDALSLRALRTPEVTIDDAEVTEGDVDATFTLSLSCPWDREVSVVWATSDQTAVAGEDYTASAGVVVIPAAETAVEVAVPVLADAVADDGETFVVDLSQVDPDDAVLLDPQAVGTIVEGSSCTTEPLGVANGFNVFVLQSVAQNGSDVEGRLAAGTSAQLANYSVGAALPGPSGDVLVVGGALIFNGGTVHHGDVVYGTSLSQSSLDVPDGTIRQGAPIDFAAEGAALESYSQQLGSLSANGTTEIPPWNAIQLTGTDPDLNVFTVPASALSAASSLSITAPAGSSVVVSFTGTSAVGQYMGFSLSGVTRDHVLYNFPEATSLILQGVGVEGSVLAPFADVQFNNGQINGTLVSRTLQGNGQSNDGLFGGCLPAATGGTP